MLALRVLACSLAVFAASPIAMAEEPAGTEESGEVAVPTCEQIAEGIHPKAVARVIKNHYSACKTTCKIDKMKGNETPDCKATCRAELKENKAAVAACNN